MISTLPFWSAMNEHTVLEVIKFQTEDVILTSPPKEEDETDLIK